MPEGPSIVILKEQVHAFRKREITEAYGNVKTFDISRLEGQVVQDFKSWGKHFLICFKDFTIRIHLMLFGTYRVNEHKDSPPRLGMRFGNDELNFYACGVRLIEGPLDDVYDWSADVMNPKWDSKKALKKLKDNPDMLVCDALLDQKIFSGVGNIIKNEVLFRVKIHPLSTTGELPATKARELVKETVHYSFQFLEWKKEFTLKKHWLAHTKKTCPRDHIAFHKEYLGKSNRRTFFCNNCQKRYG